MQISVPGMAVTDAFKSVFCSHRFDGSEQFRQRTPRHDRVFFFVNAGRFDGFTHDSTKPPQLVFGRFVFSEQRFTSTTRIDRRINPLQLRHQFSRVKSIHLNQQMRLR